MKKKEKKEKYINYRGEDKILERNYNIEMQIARRGPKIYYSKDGALKSIK